MWTKRAERCCLNKLFMNKLKIRHTSDLSAKETRCRLHARSHCIRSCAAASAWRLFQMALSQSFSVIAQCIMASSASFIEGRLLAKRALEMNRCVCSLLIQYSMCEITHGSLARKPTCSHCRSGTPPQLQSQCMSSVE